MLIPGDATCTTGCSARVHAALITALGPKFDATSADGKALAYAIGLALHTILTTDATVTPLALVAPTGGGAVTGTGTIT